MTIKVLKNKKQKKNKNRNSEILPGTSTPYTTTSFISRSLLRVPSTSVVETFSPFQRKVSPVRSLKYMWPYLSMISTSPSEKEMIQYSVIMAYGKLLNMCVWLSAPT